MKDIGLTKMKNEVHAQFHETVNSLIVKVGAATLAIELLYALFKQALDNELESLNIIRKSDLTAKISEQDRVRDTIYRGFSDTVKSFRNHFDDDTREAANRLWNIFLHYGNVTQKTLDAETAAINDILRELERIENAVEIDILLLNSWVTKLAYENANFHDLMMERYGESLEKTPYRMKTARRETDKYYRAIVAELENQLMIGKMNADNGFIIELNAIVSRFKGILAQEFGRRARNYCIYYPAV